MSLWHDIRGLLGAAAASGVERVQKSLVGEQIVAVDQDVPFDAMREALVKAGLAEPTEEKPRGLFHDPYAVMDYGGWRERPSALTYETLRMMAARNTVIAAIIQLRTNQVAQFARPQQGPYDKGYRIILRDRRDKKKQMTTAQQKQAEELERMLESTGFLLPDERPSDRDSFRTFLKKCTRDALTYDQMVFEKIRDRTGKVSRFTALPAETIRPAVVDKEHLDAKDLRERVSHVQVYEDTVIAEFSPDDIAWCVMNPRSDLRTNGFGFSPVEQLFQLVTAWLYGLEYNQRVFMQGSAIKGILNVKGAIPDRQLRAFRRMWYSMVSGVQNAWKTPILNAEDIQWQSMHSSNRDMEFGNWIDYLTKLTCSVYGIDPVEINFIYGGGGSTGSGGLFDRRPNQAEITESKDKGLIPLIDHIEDCINSHIIWELEPDFEFSFTGIDSKVEEKERDARIKEVTNFSTIDEIRALYEEDPLPDGLGELILNPTYMQWAMQKQAQAEEGQEPGEELGGPGGDEGDEGDENAPDDDGFLPGPGGPPGGPGGGEGEDLAASLTAALPFDMEALRKSAISHRLDGARQVIEIDIPEGT